MPYTPTEDRLMAFMAGLRIIDAHEHLGPEAQRLAQPQDVFTLFSHYTRHDLLSAGMDRDYCDRAAPGDTRRPLYDRLFDYDTPLAQRWALFEPYWQNIRYGAYARAALLTARLVYGVDDINAATAATLSERIAAANTPGLYQRIFDQCRIAAVLTQCARTDLDWPLAPVMPAMFVDHFRTPEQVRELAAAVDMPIKNLDDLQAALEKRLQIWIDAGCVGLKIVAQQTTAPNPRYAENALRGLLDHGERLSDDYRIVEPLRNYLLHHLLTLAARHRLTVAVHAGMWGDFRLIDAKHLLTLAPAHPEVNFDLYHLGMPSVRDALVVAKNLPNVHLNLCWSHIISPAQARSAIDEMLDQVPVNKITAFGGDYRRPVEKIVGHLHLARENYAAVLAARIDRGLLAMAEAERLLRLWFWENPLRLYPRLAERLPQTVGMTALSS